ncbi:MAG: hypothetical protein ACTS73_01490 [Arsenophonus sp. NEOnobi-MAG3]
MIIRLHHQATTIRKISTAIQANKELVSTCLSLMAYPFLFFRNGKNEMMLIIGYIGKGC